MAVACGLLAAGCPNGNGPSEGAVEDVRSGEDGRVEVAEDADALDEGTPDVEPDIRPHADGEVDADAEVVCDVDADIRDGDGDADEGDE